jgi:hypothetical protein
MDYLEYPQQPKKALMGRLCGQILRIIASLVVCAVSVLGQPAAAGVVFDQLPGPGSNSLYSSSTLNAFGGTPGYRSADDFALGSGASVTEVTWWGSQNLGGSNFTFTFYDSSAGEPGAILLTTTGSLVTSTVSTGSGWDPVSMYTSILDTPFTAAAGTTYWLSIFNAAADASWLWLTANDPGNGLVQAVLGNTSWNHNASGNLAFQLADIKQVPEPASVPMVILALALLLVGRGRQGAGSSARH